MNKWEMVRLGDVANVLRGVTYSNSDISRADANETIPILRAGNIQDKLIIDSDLIYIHKQKVSEKQLIKHKDILMCMSSGSPKLVGKTAYSYNNFHGSIGAFCSIIRSIKGVQARFLYHFLNSFLFRTWTANSSGINIKNIKHSALCDFCVPLPPLDIQKKIADELDSITSLMEKRKTQLEKLDLLIKAKFVVLGRRGEMGRCAVVEVAGLLCGTGSIIITPSTRIRADILQKILSFPTMKKNIEANSVGVTMMNLNVPLVSNFIIPLPPIELQNQFAEYVQKVEKVKESMKAGLEKIELLYNSRMQEYFG